jgi:transposase, IS5 family
MRKKNQKQLPLMEPTYDYAEEAELDMISRMVDCTPNITEYVLQDLNGNKPCKQATGAEGMSADQVVRACIVKHLYGFSYEKLAFHIYDSRSLRKFCRIGFADNGFSKSGLNANIKRITKRTWQAFLYDLLGLAKAEDIEKGRKARIDCTVVETNIHKPMDSSQLWDCVRVLTRLLGQAKETLGSRVVFSDHQRRAKRRMIGIQYAKNEKQRKPLYEDLLKITRKVIGYADKAEGLLEKSGSYGLYDDIRHFKALSEQVYDQTYRRVILDESVPAQQKIVSIFEEHTDIIVKDRRDTHYGHKICLTGGASNLILDCVILKGNPADTELVESMLDRQKEIYNRYPLKVSLDGGFASKDNLAIAKGREIKDVCFAKKRGLKETDMCRSEYTYKKLRQFRAGIESGISWLKRSFGLSRCTWKGFESFECYVLSSVVAANLLTMARKKIVPA